MLDVWWMIHQNLPNWPDFTGQKLAQVLLTRGDSQCTKKPSQIWQPYVGHRRPGLSRLPGYLPTTVMSGSINCQDDGNTKTQIWDSKLPFLFTSVFAQNQERSQSCLLNCVHTTSYLQPVFTNLFNMAAKGCVNTLKPSVIFELLRNENLNNFISVACSVVKLRKCFPGSFLEFQSPLQRSNTEDTASTQTISWHTDYM